MHAGVRVGHQPDTKQLLPSLGSFKPTFLLAVPRVFEKVYNVSEQKAEAGGKGKIFRAAAETAVAYSMAKEAGTAPARPQAQVHAVRPLVLSASSAQAMGGNVKYAVSGSAPLGPRLGHFYHALGITILEGYGLTETTAPATVNLAHKSKIGTVGPALPGVAVRLADDGEIQVKGVDVFKEYWKNPEATADSFDGEWFKTGDIGSFDDDGFLTITGRKKEIIVTAGGKNVAPAALEDPIRANPLVGQVVVVGDKKPFISALVTLDPEMLPVWLNNNGEDAGMTVEEASDEHRRARRGAAGHRRGQRARVACRVDPQVHDPRDRAHRGERPPDAEDEHQAQRHPRGLRRAHRGDVLGCARHRGALDRALSVPTRRRAPRHPRGPSSYSVDDPGRRSEPVGLADLLHRGPPFVLLEPIEVEDAVEVIGLVLQRLGHQAGAREFELVAVEVDAADPCERMPRRLVPEPGDREAALVDELLARRRPRRSRD